MLLVLGMIVVFVIVSGLTYVGIERRGSDQDVIRRRIEQLNRQPVGEPAMPEPHVDESNRSRRRPDFLPSITRLLSKSALDQKLRLAMVRSGLKLRPAEFVALCTLSSVLSALLLFGLTHQAMFLAIGGTLGLAAPLMLVRQKQEARRKRLDSQIPDALTLIASSMRSGYSFMRAVQLVVNEMPAPISEEFGWVLKEINLGASVQSALERMAAQVRSRDLELVVIAVVIQMQVGGNLAEILDTISETIRERVRIQGEIKSLTAEGRLSGVVLFLLPIVLMVMLQARDPHYFKPLLDAPQGHLILGGALAAQLVGGVVIKRMVTLDV